MARVFFPKGWSPRDNIRGAAVRSMRKTRLVAGKPQSTANCLIGDNQSNQWPGLIAIKIQQYHARSRQDVVMNMCQKATNFDWHNFDWHVDGAAGWRLGCVSATY